MRKFSNALVTFSNWICFECDENGHYISKCPQRRPKDQPTETSFTTLQTIQCSNSYKSQVIGNQNGLRSQATQNATQTPPDRKYYNCEEKGHYFNRCPNPCIHHPSVLITNIAPTSSEKTAQGLLPLRTEMSLCPLMSRSIPTTDPTGQEMLQL
jgi:hypothetical protein